MIPFPVPAPSGEQAARPSGKQIRSTLLTNERVPHLAASSFPTGHVRFRTTIGQTRPAPSSSLTGSAHGATSDAAGATRGDVISARLSAVTHRPTTGHRAAPTALATAGFAGYRTRGFEYPRRHPTNRVARLTKIEDAPAATSTWRESGPSVAAHSADPGPCPKPGQHSGRTGGGHHLSAQRRSSRSDRSRGNR